MISRLQRIGGGVLVATMGLLLSGCTPPMKIQTQWTPGVAFAHVGSSYAWAPRAPGPQAKLPEGFDAGMQRIIEEGFAKRGYRQQAPPNFLIRYHVTKTKQGDPWTPGGVEEYEEGSLLLDVLTPDTNKLAWRGWARARIDERAGPAEREARMRRAVDLLLKEFPAAKR